VSLSAADRRIRGLRPPKRVVDPYAAHGSLLEEERRPDGRRERTLTVFLAGAECPFTCSFCDLWQWTLDGPTPPGALVAQLERVLESLDGPPPDRLKLYTASNFFDRRAVPREDHAALARLAAAFSAVTVESHASTIGRAAADFARSISGRLEVAMGLETVHPRAMTELNKRLDLPRFDAAARFLSAEGIDLRAFVLLGVPHVPDEEAVDWTVRTVEHAVACGAAVVSIIPVRGGNGEMERLQALGAFTPPTLAQLEAALDRCLALGSTVVAADLWDVESLATCAACRTRRVERLARINVTGCAEPRVECDVCGVQIPRLAALARDDREVQIPRLAALARDDREVQIPRLAALARDDGGSSRAKRETLQTCHPERSAQRGVEGSALVRPPPVARDGPVRE
jgi:archaeosine synthase beta-subunit